MKPTDQILCFCPPQRLFTITLVLSSWTNVRRVVLVNADDFATDLSEFSAVIVMDGFVTKPRIDRLCAEARVFVLAWNGLFEIHRYRELLGDSADVTYVGTDEVLPPAVANGSALYLPMIDPAGSYLEWRRRFLQKQQFAARGDATYRSQWFRTQLSVSRWWRLLVSTGGALRHRPYALRKTFESGFVTHKLVWAGNCQFDVSSLGLPPTVRDSVLARVSEVRSIATPDTRLDGALRLIEDWRCIAGEYLEPQRINEGIYVANTLLRWAVLDFLVSTDKQATWFFGQDNMGLGLEFELYIYNLVSARNIAFVDFGGKTSDVALYPRSLHLLGRQCYVVPFAVPDSSESRSAVLATAERLRSGLRRKRAFFRELEDRRVTLYKDLPASSSLGDVQRRVWQDFSRHERTEVSARPTVL